MEIRCQIIFHKTCFWKIHELETLGTMQRILQKITEKCSCARKYLVAFRHFHTLVCIANQPWTATKYSSREKNTGKCMESSKHDWTLSGTASSLQFFFLKILSLVPKVSNSLYFQKRCFIKLFDIRFPYKHCYFKTCLPTRQNGVENRDKAYSELAF